MCGNTGLARGGSAFAVSNYAGAQGEQKDAGTLPPAKALLRVTNGSESLGAVKQSRCSAVGNPPA